MGGLQDTMSVVRGLSVKTENCQIVAVVRDVNTDPPGAPVNTLTTQPLPPLLTVYYYI